MRIVVCAEKRSLRLASCCSVDVMNGALGRREYGLRSTRETVKSDRSSRDARPRACDVSFAPSLAGARRRFARVAAALQPLVCDGNRGLLLASTATLECAAYRSPSSPTRSRW